MKNAILLCIGIIAATFVKAQEVPQKNAVQLGFTIGQIQQDFGIGLNITSPYFFTQKVAFRVRGNFVFNEHLDQNAQFTWTPYSNMTIGVVGVGGSIGNGVNLYGEGGFLLLFPNTDFSSTTSESGGYGLLGFEFIPNHVARYYIEIGGAGSGASADKVAGSPIYSNGLILYTGVRFSL